MKSNKAIKYVLVALVLAAVAGAAVYLSTSDRLLGFLRLGKSGVSTTTGGGKEVPWWCISQEERDAQWQNSGGSEEPANEPGISGTYNPWRETGTAGDGNFNISGLVGSDEDFNGENFSNEGFLPGTSGAPSIPGGSWSGSGGDGGSIVPDIPDINVETPEEIPGTEPEPEEEWTMVGYTCECGANRVYVTEVDQYFSCPEGAGSTDIHSVGDLDIYVSTPREAQCDSKWFCPDGYLTNWDKIGEKCWPDGISALAYGEVCRDEDNSTMLDTCSAFFGAYWPYDYFKEVKKGLERIGDDACLDLRDCTQMMNFVNQGTFTAEFSSMSYNDAASICDSLGYTSWGDWYGSHLYPEETVAPSKDGTVAPATTVPTTKTPPADTTVPATKTK
ncbi:MAG: hypothetical protein ABIH78_04160 [Candidatus Peregrinibacteria bacterium]